jgi:hypothetical protein
VSEFKNKQRVDVTTTLSLSLIGWLGGAFFVAGQPNQGFWDGVFWMWYVGRYIAANFTVLTF